MDKPENLRLAERLASIASALATPPATNGHAGVMASDLSEELLNGLAAGIVPFVKTVASEALAPLVARNAELEQRITALEKKKGLAPLASRLAELEQHAVKYRGVWNEQETYSGGTLVTFQGGMWHCENLNCGVRPGSGSSTWTLANKSRR